MELLVIYISVFHLSTFYDYSYPPRLPIPKTNHEQCFCHNHYPLDF